MKYLPKLKGKNVLIELISPNSRIMRHEQIENKQKNFFLFSPLKFCGSVINAMNLRVSLVAQLHHIICIDIPELFTSGTKMK